MVKYKRSMSAKKASLSTGSVLGLEGIKIFYSYQGTEFSEDEEEKQEEQVNDPNTTTTKGKNKIYESEDLVKKRKLLEMRK